jgi:hypothetical protein
MARLQILETGVTVACVGTVALPGMAVCRSGTKAVTNVTAKGMELLRGMVHFRFSTMLTSKHNDVCYSVMIGWLEVYSNIAR